MAKAWGSFLSGVALVKIITILPAVIFNDVFHRIFTGAFLDIGFSIIASVITAIGIILLILYLKSTSGNPVQMESSRESISNVVSGRSVQKISGR
ncbi:MAG: hypothetical protein GX267_03490 [Fibrobacter sp.]|nr:hypothetical protein [Fibrobacter sp.]